MITYPSTIVTGHSLVQADPIKPSLKFETDPDTVQLCRDAVRAIAAERQHASRGALLRDTSFERGHMYIGAAVNDEQWVDEQWASLPPSAYREMAAAVATDDFNEVGRVLKAALQVIAHREAEQRFGVKF